MKKTLPMLGVLMLLTACQEVATTPATTAAMTGLQTPGEITADQQLSVTPPAVRDMWQYTIQQMAPERALLKQGDVMLQFDDEQIRQQIAKKTAELSEARQELTNRQQQDANNLQALLIAKAEQSMYAERDQRKAAIVDHSRSELERKKMQLDARLAASALELAGIRLEKHQQQSASMQKTLQSKVDRLATELADLQQDQQKMTIRAPFAGVVNYLSNFSDEKFAVGDKVQFGMPVLELSQLQSLSVRAEIDEVHLAKLSAGMKVQIKVDALPDQMLSGQLRPLQTVVRDKSMNDARRVFDAKISFDQPPPAELRPGMTARLQFAHSAAEQSSAAQSVAQTAKSTTATSNSGAQQ